MILWVVDSRVCRRQWCGVVWCGVVWSGQVSSDGGAAGRVWGTGWSTEAGVTSRGTWWFP